jgi:hypothetical protein
VFTEPLLRNGLHNHVVPPLFGADDIENTASSIVACWTVFTGLLPGNALIKSVTICMCISLAPEQLNGFHSFYASIQSPCPVNMSSPDRKLGAVQMEPTTQIGDFLENDFEHVHEVLVIFVDHTPKQKCIKQRYAQ